MTNDELLSKTISFLRFPLIVGVVFIHNKMCEINIQGEFISYDTWPWVNNVMYFFSSVLPAISVPLFFLISGFLFFYNVDFEKRIYIKKLKSRFKTLVIPYLIWNFVGFLILLVQMHPRFLSLFPLLKDYRIDIYEFFSYFWIRDLPMDPPGEHSTPINFPFWFIRDLIVLVILSPLIYFFIKRLKLMFIIALGCVYLWGLGKYVGLPLMCHQSLFFFPLGAFFSINHINFVKLAHKAKWSPYTYILIAVADIFTMGEPCNYWLHYGTIFIGLIASLYIGSVFVESGNLSISKFLSDASFFIFAIHGLFISKYMKALVMLLNPHSPCAVLLIYFFVPITTIIFSLFIYKGICKYCPVVARVITGSR